MTAESLEICCPDCGTFTRAERVFCLRCRKRLIPLTPYDITLDDFIYSPDQDNLELLKSTGPLPYLTKHIVVRGYEEKLRSTLLRGAIRVEPTSALDGFIRRCGVMLGLEALPESFVAPSRVVNAFTFGSDDRPFLVLSSSLLRVLNERELVAVIAHELAHIKSGHMLYHTLAEMLARGIGISASFLGMGLLSLPLRFLLLSWHRESEVSADRASLLVVDDIDVMRSLMGKLAGLSPQGKEAPSGAMTSLMELYSTHPAYANRIKKIEEFYRSPEFMRARWKLRKRVKLSRALAPRCRYCGARKRLTEIFCPSCGKSQV